jgi:ATP-dependent protease ClpP protease subunit
MMLKRNLSLFIAFIVLVGSMYSIAARSTIHKDRVVKVTPDNIVMFRGHVTASSVDRVIQNLLNIKTKQVYLYLDTHGGSVLDGNSLIDVIETMQLNGKNVVCIADTAISMGFVIFQHCPTRYILPRAVLMQHQMSLGIKGPLENLKTRLQFATDLDDQLSLEQARRLNMTLNDFKANTNHDWWLFGDQILKNNAADEKVRMVCDFDYMLHNTTFDAMTQFGPVKITFSKCPLVKMPLAVEFYMETEENIINIENINDIFTNIDSYTINQNDELEDFMESIIN